MHIYALIIYFFFSTISTLEAKINLASLLLQTFDNQCPNVKTPQVAASLAHIQSMISIVEKLRADSNCQQLVNTSNILQSYQLSYQDYLSFENQTLFQDELEKKISYYTTIISDPEIAGGMEDFLRDQIFSSQAQLISVNSRQARFGQLGGRYARASNQMIAGIQGFVNSIDQSSQCLNSNAGLFSNFLSNGMLMASSFVTHPAASLGMATAGVLVNSLSKLIINLRYNIDLRKLDHMQMNLALQCSSEAITDQFCNSYEAKKLIDKREEDYGSRNPSFEGLNLLAYELNNLDHWLLEVHAGSEITSEGDLVNREKPILQYELLTKIKRYAQTFARIRTSDILKIGSLKARSDAIANAIGSLSIVLYYPTLTPSPAVFMNSSSQSVENPIFISRSIQLLPYQLYNPLISAVPLCGAQPCATFATWVQSQEELNLKISHWNNAVYNANLIVNEAMARTDLARARAIAVDAYGILVRATRQLKNETNALEGLRKIMENSDRIAQYLTDLGCKDSPHFCEGDLDKRDPTFSHPYFPQIYDTRKTKTIAEDVLKLLYEGFVPRKLPKNALPEDCRQDDEDENFLDITDEKSFVITSCISKILKLADRGNSVFFDKVRNMVGYELESRFKEGDFEEEIRDIIYLTREDLVRSLVASYSSYSDDISLNSIYEGLETAQGLNKQTLQFLFEKLEKPILKIFKDDQLSLKEKHKLCFRLTPYLHEDNRHFLMKIFPTCQNAQLTSRLKDGPVLQWGDYFYKSGGVGRYRYHLREDSEVKRFCDYRNYHRKNKLLETRRDQQQRP